MEYTALVVGGGGREHELGRQLDRSGEVDRIYFASGNAGTERLTSGQNVDIAPTDVDNLVAFAKEKNINLTIIGPEAPLAMGLADRLRAEDLRVFGPSAEAACLESSKAFAVKFMQRNNIPHPPSLVTTSAEEALDYIKIMGAEKIVIKADGLAGGKGVVLPEDDGILTADEAAEKAIYSMLSGESFEGAGRSGVIIQDRYHGAEVSVMVVTDSHNAAILPPAQDHKRLRDHDGGPNTGGMGAYAPVPHSIVTAHQWRQIEEIAHRTIERMTYEGRPYQGLLYLGLMMAHERGGDPVVIEYNARFGDPETQVLLPLLERGGVDVHDLLRLATEGRMYQRNWRTTLGAAALSVCLAAKGYPDDPRKDDVIYGLDREYPNVIIHHAGTKQAGNEVITNGGRVLYVTGIGRNIDAAAAAAYDVIDSRRVTFEGEQHRGDIGWQARSHL